MGVLSNAGEGRCKEEKSFSKVGFGGSEDSPIAHKCRGKERLGFPNSGADSVEERAFLGTPSL